MEDLLLQVVHYDNSYSKSKVNFFYVGKDFEKADDTYRKAVTCLDDQQEVEMMLVQGKKVKVIEKECGS